MSTATPSAELLATAAELWPGSQVVPAGTAADGRTVRARYAMLGRGPAPTLLVPLAPRAAISASFHRTSGATDWRTRTARRVAGSAARVVPQLMGRPVEVRGGEGGLEEHLSEVLGEPVSFSISIGAARVNRKPVLQVFDAAGRCRAFAKVGWSAHTCVDVTTEGRALAVLGACQFRLLSPPALLSRTWWRDRPVVVTEPLQPAPWPSLHRSAGRHPWQPPVNAMHELTSRFASRPGTLAASAWWARQWRTVGGLGDPATRDRLNSAMDQVAQFAGSTTLQWGAWHGDWTPWNMAADGSRVLLWDWERFESVAPAGMDLLHFVLNVATAGTPSGPGVVLRALDVAAQYLPPGPSRDSHEVVARLYLIAILTRYLRLAEVPGGEHIAPRAAQVLIALETMGT